MATSAEQIANLGLSLLGQYGSIESIETPVKPTEKVMAKWWELARQTALKELKPNFALARDNLAVDDTAPAFGYSYRYRKPANSLAILGLDEIRKKKNVYTIEGDYILTDEYSGEEMPVRYVKDIEDITKFTPEMVYFMAFYLAYFGCMEITEDIQKQAGLEQMLPSKKSTASALNGQENRPIRITRSKFKQARRYDVPSNNDKL